MSATDPGTELIRQRLPLSSPLAAADVGGLRPWQRDALPRAWRVLTSRRGVLLADELGAGKTWLAVGLARLASRRTGLPVRLVAPARLLPMWRRVCEALGVSLASAQSHRMASLERLAGGGRPACWLVDEAHEFRNADTRRYQALAGAVAPGLTVLVSATPYNVRPGDVSALLALIGQASDADDVASIRESLERVAIRTHYSPEQEIEVHRDELELPVDSHWTSVLELLISARFPSFGTGADSSGLLRDVLLARFASHPEALRGTVGRLERYYRRCRGPDGQLLGREVFREFFGADGPTQGLLSFAWPAAGSAAEDESARTSVLAVLAGVRTAMETVEKPGSGQRSERVAVLHGWLESVIGRARRGQSGPPGPGAVLFTQYADSAKAWASELGRWWTVGLLTGDTAKIGGLGVDPDVLVGAFDPQRAVQLDCPVLVCTDVLGQGHNLQRARGLVHLDRPWNPVRLRQREGRLVRAGQPAPVVDVATVRMCAESAELDAFLARVDRALAQRTEQAQALWIPPDQVERIWWPDATPSAVRRISDAVLSRIRPVRRHPSASQWLESLGHLRAVAAEHPSAGLLRAMDELDVDQLPDSPGEALQQVMASLRDVWPWREG